jgi:hypothetical protein
MTSDLPVLRPRDRSALIWLALLLPWTALLGPVHEINHDVSWFFYVARGVLRGGTLYRDFVEPNAPLASLSLVPAVWLTQTLGIVPGLAVELVVLAVASVSMALCVAVLCRLRLDRARLLFAVLAVTFAFAFLPGANFGQREHILAMLLTPYALAAAANLAGARMTVRLDIALGAAASIAVILKPPFILVPAMLEAVALWQARWRWRPGVRLTTLAAALALMTAGTLAFFPLYARNVVPWATALYGGYNQPKQVAAVIVGVLDAAVIAWLGWDTGAGAIPRALRVGLTVAMVAALGAYGVQCKGWLYQAFPALLFLFLSTAGAIATTALWPGRSAAAWVRWLPPRAILAAFVYYVVTAAPRSVEMERFADIAREVAAEPGPFLILSTNVVPAFPLALQTDRVWASRIPCLIMLPGLAQAEQRGVTSDWDGTFRTWIREDLQRYKPALIFVPLGGQQALPPDFDVLAWLLRDPGFAAIWSHYHQDGVRDGMRMFRAFRS